MKTISSSEMFTKVRIEYVLGVNDLSSYLYSRGVTASCHEAVFCEMSEAEIGSVYPEESSNKLAAGYRAC